MKNRLEEFVNRNREAFDAESPQPEVWKAIEKTALKNKAKLFNLITFRQLAASLLILANAVTLFILLERKNDGTSSTVTTPVEQVSKNNEPVYEKELDQIGRIILVKQAKLKEIEKTNPVLYKTFIGALGQLNNSYHQLEKELGTNPNKEALLEAMIQNLSLQQELLNQQLSIYQKIKQSKNEKVHTTI